MVQPEFMKISVANRKLPVIVRFTIVFSCYFYEKLLTSFLLLYACIVCDFRRERISMVLPEAWFLYSR